MSVMEKTSASPAQVPLASQRNSSDERSRGRKIFERLYVLYIYMLILLPTGSIFGVNVKFGCFAFLFVFALGQMDRENFRSNVFLLSPLIFIPWIAIGIFNGFPLQYPLYHYKDLVSMLLTCWVSLVFCRNSDVYRLKCVNLVIRAMVIVSGLKLGIVLYAIITATPYTIITDSIDRIFRIQITVLVGETFLGRISFLPDILIPICIFAVISYRIPLRLSKLQSAFYLAVLFTSQVYNFSRYGWFYTVLATLLGIVSGKKDSFKRYTILAIVIASLLLRSNLKNIASERFDADRVDSSDAIRELQIPQLERLFERSPFFGSGLGSYTLDQANGRGGSVDLNPGMPYSYEIEWLALSAQLGVVGIILILALATIYFCGLRKRQQTLRTRTILGSMLFLWALGGFTNPAVAESVPAVAYSVLMALADLKMVV